MSEHKTILKTENLVVGYGDHTVLSDVSFELEKGEVLVVIGQNGSGKSTLLKTLIGLLPPKAGNFEFNHYGGGHTPPYKLVDHGISYFPQGGMIIPALTVREHLHLAATKKSEKLQRAMFDNIFTEFPKLKEMESKRAGILSGGERQILSFSILSMQQTSTWILDEPTAGLSPEMVQFTTEYLLRKNGEGITMLLVEHNMDMAFRLASHIVVAKEGSITPKYTRQQFNAKDFLNNIVYN